AKKKSKPLNLKIHSGVGSCENIPAQQRSPLLSERSLRSFFVGHAPFLPSTPPVHTEANFSASPREEKKNAPKFLNLNSVLGSQGDFKSNQVSSGDEDGVTASQESESSCGQGMGYPDSILRLEIISLQGQDTLSVPRWSPQIPRRDLGNSIKHRFSTKYWMSQTCTVCGKGMLFGLKCKNCKKRRLSQPKERPTGIVHFQK
ncbi:hypothetical protein STEG23_015970, partial [Scotinomys teguina]